MVADNPHAAETVIAKALYTSGAGSPLDCVTHAENALFALRKAVASGRLTPEQVGAAVGLRAVLEHRELAGDGGAWEPPLAGIAVASGHAFRARLVADGPDRRPSKPPTKGMP